MNTTKQLLKWLIENSQWLEKTHDELFAHEPTLFKIHLVAKRILKANRPISFEALKYATTKHQDLQDQLNYLQNETSVDKATALLIREDLRQLAIATQIKMSQNLDMKDPKAFKRYIETLNRLQQEDVPEEGVQVSSFRDWKRHIEPEATTVDSGLPFLKDTGADFQKGRLYNILAPSNEFKSGTLSHFTRHQIAKGRNVLFFEMEGTDQENFHRIGHGLLQLTPYQYNQLTPEQLGDRYDTFNLGNLETVWGKIIYVEDIIDTVKELEEKNGYKYDVIIIDYSAQVKLKQTKKTNQHYQDDEEVFRQLKLIAIQLQTVIVSAVQANRSAYNRKKSVGRDNAAASMGSIHASDLVLAQRYITRVPDEYATPLRETESEEEPKDAKGMVRMEILKKRKGAVKVGDVHYFLHLANGNIRYITSNHTQDQGMDELEAFFKEEETEDQ